MRIFYLFFSRLKANLSIGQRSLQVMIVTAMTTCNIYYCRKCMAIYKPVCRY